MKRLLLNTTLAICFLFASGNFLLAEDALEPGNWEKVERLEHGSQILIQAVDWKRVECRFYGFRQPAILHGDGDGIAWEVFLDIKSLICTGSNFHGMREDEVAKISRMDEESGSEELIYISEREAWKQARREAGLIIPLLVDSEPIPGLPDILRALNKEELIIIHKKNDEKVECLNRGYLYPMYELISTRKDGERKRRLNDEQIVCYNDPSGLTLRIDLETIDTVTITDRNSGAEKTVYISDEATESSRPDLNPE